MTGPCLLKSNPIFIPCTQSLIDSTYLDLSGLKVQAVLVTSCRVPGADLKWRQDVGEKNDSIRLECAPGLQSDLHLVERDSNKYSTKTLYKSWSVTRKIMALTR